MRLTRAVAAAGPGLALAPAVSPAADADLRAAHRTLFPAAEAAARGVSASSPDGTQAGYDAARDLQEAVRAAGPVSGSCRGLERALAGYATARVRQAEGVDRLSRGQASTAGDRAQRLAAVARRSAGSCPGTALVPTPRAPVIQPSSGEATFGAVVARAPAGAERAVLVVDGQIRTQVAVRGGRARATVRGEGGRHDLELRFLRDGRVLGTIASRGVWLLPPSARATRGAVVDAARSRRVAAALAGAPRFAAAWVHQLASGRAGGVNADAAFPAASTVKLGLMATALRRLGAAPERAPLWYDVSAMVRWSSNLANNRLLARLGAGAAADGLRRLGARASTFTGPYIVGTARAAATVHAAPPRVSQRVTSARDLGRMLATLHAAAAGVPAARRGTGLTAHQARLGLGLLLASEQRGDNRSLLAAGAGGAPVAQKNGWLRAARHGAGIIYSPSGPAVAVLLTYDAAGVSRTSAAGLGARVARAARRG